MAAKKKGFLDVVKYEIKSGIDWLKKEGVSEGVKTLAKEFLAEHLKITLIDVIRKEIADLKKAIVNSIAFGVFLFSGIVICLVGFANLLAAIFPVISNGTNFLILGLVLISVASLFIIESNKL